MVKLYNTLGRQIQDFEPLNKDEVKVYTCGPTVYDHQHIGNYSGYVYWDILVRLLRAQGYGVKRIMNVTDVGHLVSDADDGEDKLERGAKREGKSAKEIADFYTEDFFKAMKSLNLIEPQLYARATDYIPQQIEMVQVLLDKGFAYQTEQAIYFDTRKLDDYGKLTGQKLSEMEVGARAEVKTDDAKHHPQDFALWFFTVGRFADHQMHWDSPWGQGFPGWHLECSAIVHATLGEPIDIHTGGVDHIGTHHTNEIAQTEAAFGVQLSKFWLHNNHMMVGGQKISKSLGNGYTLEDLAKKGFSPLDFKMLVLQSHFRSQSNFSWEALAAAKTNLDSIRTWAQLAVQTNAHKLDQRGQKNLEQALRDALEADLNTPEALAAINEAMDAGAPSAELLKTIDELLGLNLSGQPDINDEQMKLLGERETARKAQDWSKADQLRDQLKEQGLEVNDTDNGPLWSRPG